jgi:hypothetical protein
LLIERSARLARTGLDDDDIIYLKFRNPMDAMNTLDLKNKSPEATTVIRKACAVLDTVSMNSGRDPFSK